MPALERGVCLLWFGQIHLIPDGFVLCDGDNGTPDLRDKFILGAGLTFDPGDQGGSTNHTHEFTGDGHVHFMGVGPNLSAGSDYDSETSETAVTGITDPRPHLPPYYALAWIMKT